MQIMKKLLVMTLALSTALSFAACSGGDSTLDILESVPDLEISKEVVEEQSQADPKPAEGQTAMPIISQVYNSNQTTVVIAGTCEKDAEISASFVGGEISTVKANGTVFALELEVGDRQEAHIQVTATAPDKKVSEPKLVVSGYHPTADGNLVHPTVLADGVVLFPKDSLSVLSEDAVVSNSTTDKLIDRVNSNLASLKKTETELIYVMIPNKASSMKDTLPDGTDVSENIGVYSQIKDALNKTDATVIDMADVFATADTSKYPIYYRTHSTWSEYGAYLTYKTVMDYIAQKYPEAAPHAMDKFDIKEVKNALGGDLAYHFGLDIEKFTETVYDFVPKFNTAIGDSIPEELAEDYENKLLINAVQQYLGDNDYRFFNEYFVNNKIDADKTLTRGDDTFGFFTGRKELPTALIYRDEYSIPMIDMLAERFNNVLFEASGKLNFKYDAVADYAAEGAKNVNYIIVLLSEDSLPTFIAANAQ